MRKQEPERRKITTSIKPDVLERIKLKRIELEARHVKPRDLAMNRILEYLIESREFDQIIEEAVHL